MSKLQTTIDSLATEFATKLLAALRGASLEEVMSFGGKVSSGKAASGKAAAPVSAPAASQGRAPAAAKKGGRLPRRSADDLASMVEQIAGVLGKNSGGLRAEQIRAALGVDSKELPRPLKEGLESGRFSKSGEKRATVYTLGGGKSKRGGKKG